MAFAGLLRQVFALLLIAVLATPLLSQNLPTRPQNSGGGSSSTNLSFTFDEKLGTTFYVDMLGLEASRLPFSPEVRINPASYIVGPNDLIGVIITGTFSLNYRALGVNVEGDLYIPSVGVVQIAGLTLLDAKEAIKASVDSLYRNVSVDVFLDKPRPLTIHISGDLPNPGRLSLPYGTRLDAPLLSALYGSIALDSSSPEQNSATKAITQSTAQTVGMTGTSGSRVSDMPKKESIKTLLDSEEFQLRSVRIIRNGNQDFIADLYDYYYGGNLNANPLLVDGDLIVVQKSNPSLDRVSLSGAVNKQLDIHYQANDTFDKLLRISGGYTSNADTLGVIVFRSDSSGVKTFTLDLLADSTSAIHLLPNDRIVVNQLKRNSQNARATVIGMAQSPGIYPIIDRETTAFDLIKMAGGLDQDALMMGAFITRASDKSQPTNSLSKSNLAQILRGSDQMAQGLNWFELEEEARRNRVYLDLRNESQLRSTKIQNGDSLYIPVDERTVFVYGQVNSPSYIQVNTSWSYKDYIDAVGGFSLSADTSKVYLIKAGTKTWMDARQTSVASGDWIYVDRIPLDDLAQQRQYDLLKESYDLQRQSLIQGFELQKQGVELQKQGFKLQRQGLYTAAFTAVLSAISSTIVILIYSKN
jgi:polysaccharide export outer membrane protein